MARILESDLTLPVLEILAEAPNGQMLTADLVAMLQALLPLSEEDQTTLSNRRDNHFSQIVRNIVSHKTCRGNLIYEGFADYLGRSGGLRITDAGREHLALLTSGPRP